MFFRFLWIRLAVFFSNTFRQASDCPTKENINCHNSATCWSWAFKCRTNSSNINVIQWWENEKKFKNPWITTEFVWLLKKWLLEFWILWRHQMPDDEIRNMFYCITCEHTHTHIYIYIYMYMYMYIHTHTHTQTPQYSHTHYNQLNSKMSLSNRGCT